jgi:hypothetical protein
MGKAKEHWRGGDWRETMSKADEHAAAFPWSLQMDTQTSAHRVPSQQLYTNQCSASKIGSLTSEYNQGSASKIGSQQLNTIRTQQVKLADKQTE